ncbi:DUF2777 family protein [Bacillus sp. 165]|uniref:DUF2777 family protein n=1 Tax=Bacillus sp. 165 TaxID=1529117 RepID=UPI001ADCE861|nr:DUF2777 family protein [Bacillus sp. 165]MBO9128693.1 DUF2777 family protein [Bacillus sp. 165]
MELQNRYHIFREQPRAHTLGNIEYINEEWIFFDEESDEAFSLWDIIEDDFEILYNNNWLPARFYEDKAVKVDNELYPLQDGEMIRVKKKLHPTYEEWLKLLSDNAFSAITNVLKQSDYSLYDCIFCHNFLGFQPKNTPCQGVNIIIFDNLDLVCALHHHFVRDENGQRDQFEFVRTDGQKYSIAVL